MIRSTRSLPQEEPTTKFNGADLRLLGDASMKLGMLHWQESPDIGTPENQIAILLIVVDKLNRLVSNLLLREL